MVHCLAQFISRTSTFTASWWTNTSRIHARATSKSNVHMIWILTFFATFYVSKLYCRFTFTLEPWFHGSSGKKMCSIQIILYALNNISFICFRTLCLKDINHDHLYDYQDRFTYMILFL